jgi:hypothetical protein
MSALSHVKSNPIADFTGTVTVFNSAGATATANATDLVRPGDWNSAHNFFQTISGNTLGTSTASGTNLVIGATGGISASHSTAAGAATLWMSAPAVSSLSATGAIQISTNGSTISIGVLPQTATMWFPFNEGVNVAGQHGQATWQITPVPTPPTADFGVVSIDRVCFPVVFSNSSNSTGSATLSMSMGLYSKNGSTLSLAHSTTGTLAITFSGTVNNSTFAGMRLMTVPWTTQIGEGRWYVGIASRTTTAGGNCSASQMQISQVNSNFSGLFGANSNRSHQWPLGFGVMSVSSSGVPSSIAFSNLDGTASLAARAPSWFMLNGTA